MPSLLTFLQKLRKEQRTASSSSPPPICVTHTLTVVTELFSRKDVQLPCGRTHCHSGSHESFPCGQNSRPARQPASTGRARNTCVTRVCCFSCGKLEQLKCHCGIQPFLISLSISFSFHNRGRVVQALCCVSRLSKNMESSSGKIFVPFSSYLYKRW